MDKIKQKKDLSTSNFVALMVTISAVLVLGGGVVSYNLAKSVLHTKHIVDKKAVAKKTLDRNVVAAKELVDSYNAAAPQKTLLADALPTEADFPAFANAMEVIARVSGVKLAGVGSGLPGVLAAPASTIAGGVVPLQVSLKLTSSYANLTKFLSVLESSARPVHISGIVLSGTNTSLEVAIDATTYYQTPAEYKIKMEAVK